MRCYQFKLLNPIFLSANPYQVHLKCLILMDTEMSPFRLQNARSFII